jgi:hypothetical protein
MPVRPAMSLPTGGGGGWDDGPAVAMSHADSGSGFTIPGMKDASGRPPVFSRGGANAFAAMVRDSGGLVKASDIASSQRSEAKNRAVGGANGSHHLSGNAMDIHGTSEAWIRKHGAKYGWYVHDYDGTHGGHFEFRGGGSASRGGAVSGNPAAYLKRLAYLETRIRNVPNAEGSGATGYFQAMGPFNQEAIAASGGISPRDPDYDRSSQATWAWIQKHNSKAAEAIKAGRYDEADRLLRNTWPSLPGGSQAQSEQVQREARRYLGLRSSAEPDTDLASQLVAQLGNEKGFEDVAGLDLRGIVKKVESAVQPATKAIYQQFDKLFGSGTAAKNASAAVPPGDTNARIAAAAEAFRGQSTAAGPDRGREACAWAVNQVLKKAGMKVPWVEAGQESVYIPYITDAIRKGAGREVPRDQVKPGDLMVLTEMAHVGIVLNKKGGAGDWQVLSNSSSRASFSWQDSLPSRVAMGVKYYRLNSQGRN